MKESSADKLTRCHVGAGAPSGTADQGPAAITGEHCAVAMGTCTVPPNLVPSTVRADGSTVPPNLVSNTPAPTEAPEHPTNRASPPNSIPEHPHITSPPNSGAEHPHSTPPPNSVPEQPNSTAPLNAAEHPHSTPAPKSVPEHLHITSPPNSVPEHPHSTCNPPNSGAEQAPVEVPVEAPAEVPVEVAVVAQSAVSSERRSKRARSAGLGDDCPRAQGPVPATVPGADHATPAAILESLHFPGSADTSAAAAAAGGPAGESKQLTSSVPCKRARTEGANHVAAASRVAAAATLAAQLSCSSSAANSGPACSGAADSRGAESARCALDTAGAVPSDAAEAPPANPVKCSASQDVVGAVTERGAAELAGRPAADGAPTDPEKCGAHPEKCGAHEGAASESMDCGSQRRCGGTIYAATAVAAARLVDATSVHADELHAKERGDAKHGVSRQRDDVDALALDATQIEAAVGRAQGGQAGAEEGVGAVRAMRARLLRLANAHAADSASQLELDPVSGQPTQAAEVTAGTCADVRGEAFEDRDVTEGGGGGLKGVPAGSAPVACSVGRMAQGVQAEVAPDAVLNARQGPTASLQECLQRAEWDSLPRADLLEAQLLVLAFMTRIEPML